jgi:predicted nucleotidyltransferase
MSTSHSKPPAFWLLAPGSSPFLLGAMLRDFLLSIRHLDLSDSRFTAMILHQSIQDELKSIAREFEKQGIELFVFGSCARQWPLVPSNADLDIGYRTKGRHDIDKERITQLENDLHRKLENLPTIRPVDLVNFDHANPDFVSIANRHRVRLT